MPQGKALDFISKDVNKTQKRLSSKTFFCWLLLQIITDKLQYYIYLVSSVVNYIACCQRQVFGTCFYSLGCFKIRYITFINEYAYGIYVVLSYSICIHKCTCNICDIRKFGFNIICTNALQLVLTFEVCSTILIYYQSINAVAFM